MTFICERCHIEVHYDESFYTPLEELLCEDCYLDTIEEGE